MENRKDNYYMSIYVVWLGLPLTISKFEWFGGIMHISSGELSAKIAAHVCVTLAKHVDRCRSFCMFLSSLS